MSSRPWEEGRLVEFLLSHFSSVEQCAHIAGNCIGRSRADEDDNGPATMYIHPIASQLSSEMRARIRQADSLLGPPDLKYFLLIVAAERLAENYLSLRFSYRDEIRISPPSEPHKEQARYLFRRFILEGCSKDMKEQLSQWVYLQGKPNLDCAISYLYWIRNRITHVGPHWPELHRDVRDVPWSEGTMKLSRTLKNAEIKVPEPIDYKSVRTLVVNATLGLLVRGMNDVCRDQSRCLGHSLSPTQQEDCTQ